MSSTPTTAGDDRVKARSPLAGLLSTPEVGALIGAFAVLVLFLAVAPAFRSVGAIGTIGYLASTIGMMAVPVALLMIGGEFDLSAGVAMTTSALVASMFAWQFSTNLWIGVIVSLVVALLVGFLNGWLLVRTKLPSFLVTLGTFFILQGFNLAMTKKITGGVTSPRIADMDGFDAAQKLFAASWKLGGITIWVTIIFWVLLTALGAVVLAKTQLGNWILASGGDQNAARAVGVPVTKVKIGLFMFVGFCAWLLGMHTLFRFGSVQSNIGVGDEFIFIIAAVVGGCLLTGGYGSVIGASLGALIYGMTNLGITYAGWDPDWLKTFLGIMLVLATLVNTYIRRQAEKR
ncbi:ABC transporter permease [Yimella sp. cx-573]|nr:ABC transporter permease [Yimella sp. cx-573]